MNASTVSGFGFHQILGGVAGLPEEAGFSKGAGSAAGTEVAGGLVTCAPEAAGEGVTDLQDRDRAIRNTRKIVQQSGSFFIWSVPSPISPLFAKRGGVATNKERLLPRRRDGEAAGRGDLRLLPASPIVAFPAWRITSMFIKWLDLSRGRPVVHNFSLQPCDFRRV